MGNLKHIARMARHSHILLGQMIPRRALIVGSDPTTRGRLIEVVRRLGLEAIHVNDGEVALERTHQIAPTVIILDLSDPPARHLVGRLARRTQVPIIAVADATNLRAAVEAARTGAVDVLDKRDTTAEFEQIIRAVLPPETSVPGNEILSPSGDIFRHSLKMRALEGVVAKLATVETPVLIRGETGVGKERIAVAIHRLSDRSDRHFLKLRCAAMPSDRLEAELDRIVRGAHGVSLFLDEVDAASAIHQARLFGIVSDERADIRVLAATSANMYGLVAAGLFRADLYERLSVATIDVPPLRDRPEEIGWLTQCFLQRFSREFQRPVPPVSEALSELLRTYSWPGNVRELEHIVKRWVVLGDEDQVRQEIEARRLTVMGNSYATTHGGAVGLRDIARRAAREAERLALQEALNRFRGNKSAAARHLRVSYKTLLQKLAQAGLSNKRTRS